MAFICYLTGWECDGCGDCAGPDLPGEIDIEESEERKKYWEEIEKKRWEERDNEDD